MCVQLLKNVWNILIHVVLFFIKWHVYENKKQNKTAESARQKIENYRVPEYIFLSDV